MENKKPITNYLPGIIGLGIIAMIIIYAVASKIDFSSNSNTERSAVKTPVPLNTLLPAPSQTVPPTITPLPTISPVATNSTSTVAINSTSTVATNSSLNTSQKWEKGDFFPPKKPEFDWVTKVYEAELYEEPDPNSNIMTTLEEGSRVKINFRENDRSRWYYVTSEDGDKGWIDGNFIEKVREPK